MAEFAGVVAVPLASARIEIRLIRLASVVPFVGFRMLQLFEELVVLPGKVGHRVVRRYERVFILGSLDLIEQSFLQIFVRFLALVLELIGDLQLLEAALTEILRKYVAVLDAAVDVETEANQLGNTFVREENSKNRKIREK